MRLPLVARRAAEAGATVAYVNMVGGQDELVFDGDSMVVAAGRQLLARAPQFAEQLLVARPGAAGRRRRPVPRAAPAARCGSSGRVLDEPVPALDDAASRRRTVAPRLADEAEVWQALVLGLRDYVRKNGFRSVILGLSGGIDSAVVAAIAVDALGAEPGVRRVDAVGATRPSTPRTTRPTWPAGPGCTTRSSRSQPMVDAFLANIGADRAGRGEPPGPGARHDPDGAVQPGRPPGAHHRQQERAGGRLLDPLRRLGRRLRPDQGRAEDAGVAAGPVAQRRGGARAARCRRSRRTRSPSRRAPSCARASSTPTRCPTTTCSTRAGRLRRR